MRNVLVTSVIFATLLVSSACAQQANNLSAEIEFQGFWSEFRAAVLAGEKEKIAALTQFPFQTRGVDDSDSLEEHDRASFLKIYDKLLEQDPGFAPQPDTMKKFIEKKTTITSKDLDSGGNGARVANFVFTKRQGKWLFSRAYLDTLLE